MSIITSADYLKDKYLNTWRKGGEAHPLTPNQKAIAGQYVILDERLAQLFQYLSQKYHIREDSGTLFVNPAERTVQADIWANGPRLELELTSTVRLADMPDCTDIDQVIAGMKTCKYPYEELIIGSRLHSKTTKVTYTHGEMIDGGLTLLVHFNDEIAGRVDQLPVEGLAKIALL